MLKQNTYKRAYILIMEALDLAIDQAIKEDRDNDYDRLVNYRYELDELYTIMNEMLRR